MKDLAIVLGIRPDVIRASKILKLLDNQNQIEFDFDYLIILKSCLL